MQTSCNKMKIAAKHIWIDLCHAPHVLFFKPIIEQLQKEGHQVSITVRDAFETTDLAKKYLQHYQVIGKHYGKWKLNKLIGLIIRSLQLTLFAFNKKIDLSINLGSPFQIIAASLLGIPSVAFADYEYSNKIFYNLFAEKIVVPEIIPDDALRANKISLKKIFKFSGIKEDVYISHFKPNKEILNQLGLDTRKIIVTVRPPADKAHYHNARAEDLLTGILNYLVRKPEVQITVLPRDKRQKQQLCQQYDGRIIIPSHAVDSISLLYYSDAVFGGGGTMNREAAALNIPVYSFFQGTIGAVDQYLANNGKLQFINSMEQIQKLQLRKRSTLYSHCKIYDAFPEVMRIIRKQLL